MRGEMHALLGQVFDQLSLSKQGEAHWRRAVETQQALFGSRDARTAKAKKGLAISLARQARYAEAEPLFKELLDQEQVLGRQARDGQRALELRQPEAPDRATTPRLRRFSRGPSRCSRASGSPPTVRWRRRSTNLGLVYSRTGRGREAVKFLERALAIHVKNQGRGSSLNVTNALSYVHRDLGELDIAERYGEETLAAAEQLYPPNHPFIADTLASLGSIARLRGDRARARALYQRSIKSYDGSQPNASGHCVPAAVSGRVVAGRRRSQGGGAPLRACAGRAAQGVRRPPSRRRRELAGAGPRSPGRERSERSARGGTARPSTRSALRLSPTAHSSPAGSSFSAICLRLTGRPREALPYLEEAHAIWSRNPPKNPKELGDLEASIAAARAARR